MERGALISDCGAFRYQLIRKWDEALPCLCFVMLNPSTADAQEDDPTIRKCVGFAKRNGYGSIQVVNLYAYRATDPADLRRAGMQEGPENWREICLAVRRCEAVVLAWGAFGPTSWTQRVGRLLGEIKLTGLSPLCLGKTQEGKPRHPLMVPYSQSLIPFKEPSK